MVELEYRTASAFAEDYRANLSSGGVFVPTEQSFALRDLVTVRMQLMWCAREIDLDGEVVHIVPPELAGVGGKPGVAVQFLTPPAELRARLAPLCEGAEAPPGKPVAGEDRAAPRKSVRVPARIDAQGGPVEGRTRNLSRTGVLIELDDGSAAVGERVSVSMRHPATAQELAVGGSVVREVKSGGRVSAVAVHFEPEVRRGDRVERFLEALLDSEHTRQLGAISGPLTELGAQSIVQMFATTARRGSIVLRSGEEEGLICFDGGLLRAVRLGATTGMKALVRMLAWRDGTFEFHTTIEVPSTGDPPFPLEAAVLDAVRQIDEAEGERAAFPLQARLVARQVAGGELSGTLTKVEEALLDLASVGFTVQRALEVIPEPDAEIFRALRSLVDGEMLELR